MTEQQTFDYIDYCIDREPIGLRNAMRRVVEEVVVQYGADYNEVSKRLWEVFAPEGSDD
jgi:hypothetical protein